MWGENIKRTRFEEEKFKEVFRVARERATEVAKAKGIKKEIKAREVLIKRPPTYLEKLTGQMFGKWEKRLYAWPK